MIRKIVNKCLDIRGKSLCEGPHITASPMSWVGARLLLTETLQRLHVATAPKILRAEHLGQLPRSAVSTQYLHNTSA